MGVADAPTLGVRRRALFVDRDGTITPDLHYLKDAARLDLFKGVGVALRLVRERGWLVVCVTNQSGVERGYYTESDVAAIHARANELLRAEGSAIDAFYHCPHAPERGCRCRKPGTELFERAAREQAIDLASSAVVGDRVLDAQAGRTLGMVTARVRNPRHAAEIDREFRDAHVEPDVVADTFPGAVLRVLASG